MQKVCYVLVSGEAGIGKSAMVHQLAHNWANCKDLKDVRLLYVVDLGKLQN